MIHDERYPLCDECHYFSRDRWKGEEWEICNRWGFRLTDRVDNPDKCGAFTTTENFLRMERLEKEKAKQKRKRNETRRG